MEDKKQEIVEVDEKFVSAVAEKMQSAVAESISKAVSEAVEKTLEATEKTIKKEIGDEEPKKDLSATRKEMRFGEAAIALARGNREAVKAYNEFAMEARSKAGYGNEGVDADGGYLIPDPDFDVEVERLEEEYGVAFQYADVRRISGNSVKLNKKAGGFELTKTSEAGVKPGVKFTIGQVTADLIKYTGIAPATDELTVDAAIDYWAEVTKEAAYARSKAADEMVFTDATSGIIEIAGTAAQTIGAALTDLDWDDIMDAEVKVPSMSQKNGKWYMHRTVWTKLIQTKDAVDGRYQFNPNPNNPTTPWGTPVVFTEVLPTAATIGANTAFAVFGDLKYYKVYVKNGLELTLLTEGIVKDADGTDFNLATQDGKALRIVARMLGVAKFAEAFCILGTGSVS